MSTIRSNSATKLVHWGINYGNGDVELEIRFDNGTSVALDTEAIGQLLEAIPHAQRQYDRAMLARVEMCPNPHLPS